MKFTKEEKNLFDAITSIEPGRFGIAIIENREGKDGRKRILAAQPLDTRCSLLNYIDGSMAIGIPEEVIRPLVKKLVKEEMQRFLDSM